MLENSVERERFHDLTHFIANLEWRVGEFNFFQSLVKKLAEVAAIEYAFIGRLLDGADEIEIEILAVFAHGKVAKIFCYALAGTPCEKLSRRPSARSRQMFKSCFQVMKFSSIKALQGTQESRFEIITISHSSSYPL